VGVSADRAVVPIASSAAISHAVRLFEFELCVCMGEWFCFNSQEAAAMAGTMIRIFKG
jgi:hypothetical protein